MLVYPYELNGRQLYQDHPAGQCCSARGYDVAKLIFSMQPPLYPHPDLSPATHTEGKKNTPTVQIRLHVIICRFFLASLSHCFPVARTLILNLAFILHLTTVLNVPIIWTLTKFTADLFKSCPFRLQLNMMLDEEHISNWRHFMVMLDISLLCFALLQHELNSSYL